MDGGTLYSHSATVVIICCGEINMMMVTELFSPVEAVLTSMRDNTRLLAV
jgi:hypothetical protein